jgi:hypothetical protein
MADPLDEMIDAATGALRIPLEPEWKAEVKTQLQVTLRHGALVAEFPLPDDAEPAPIFRA